MAAKRQRSTSSSQRDAAADSSTTTTMGGWICLSFRELVLADPPKALQIDSTKTIGTAHSPTSQRRPVCTRSDGPAAYALETTTTTVSMISSAPATGKISFIVTMATERSRM